MEVAPVAMHTRDNGSVNQHWFNAEDNSDLDTSNESYMSSSDEEEEFPTLLIDGPNNGRISFGGNPQPSLKSGIHVMKEFTREDKALVSRRFEPYFRKIRVDAWDYFHPNNKKIYNRKDWMKLQFDGQIKRCHTMPQNLEELLKLARSRFGVLECILETGQFKPLVTFKSPKMAKHVLIETSIDL